MPSSSAVPTAASSPGRIPHQNGSEGHHRERQAVGPMAAGRLPKFNSPVYPNWTFSPIAAIA